MLKRIEKKYFRKSRIRLIYVCECDVCQKEIELPPCRAKWREYHTCSIRCQNKAQCRGGPIFKFKTQHFLKNYGVENPFQSSEIKEQIEKKHIEDFGSMEEFHKFLLKKRTVTNLINYGVENAQQRSEISEKTKATKIQKGVKQFQSTLELEIEKLLKKIYKDVHTQQWIDGRPIDFYIKDIDLYIQVDGEFYHGLTERSLKYFFVKNNYDRDRKQDLWFKEHNLQLLRLSEKTCRSLINEQDLKDLISAFLP